MTAGATAAGDTLALAKAAGLMITDAERVDCRMDEVLMGAPHTKSAGTIARCTAHD